MGVDTSLTGVPDFDKIEVIKQGTATMPAIGAGTFNSSITIPHGLGYPPTALVYLYSETDQQHLMLPWTSLGSTGQGWAFIPSTDSTNLYIDYQAINQSAAFPEIKFKWFLIRFTSKTN